MITIRRIGVLSLAKLFGAVFGGLGLAGGLLTSGLGFLGILLGVSGDSYFSATSLGTMFAAVFILPIIYAVLGLIGGIVTAFLCNLALRFGGGLELEAEVREKPAPPPAVTAAQAVEPAKPAKTVKTKKGKKKA
jgi:hypothetical protein